VSVSVECYENVPFFVFKFRNKLDRYANDPEAKNIKSGYEIPDYLRATSVSDIRSDIVGKWEAFHKKMTNDTMQISSDILAIRKFLPQDVVTHGYNPVVEKLNILPGVFFQTEFKENTVESVYCKAYNIVRADFAKFLETFLAICDCRLDEFIEELSSNKNYSNRNFELVLNYHKFFRANELLKSFVGKKLPDHIETAEAKELLKKCREFVKLNDKLHECVVDNIIDDELKFDSIILHTRMNRKLADVVHNYVGRIIASRTDEIEKLSQKGKSASRSSRKRSNVDPQTGGRKKIDTKDKNDKGPTKQDDDGEGTAALV
jgi:hypothetical protein